MQSSFMMGIQKEALEHFRVAVKKGINLESEWLELLEDYETYSNYYQGIIEYYLGFLKFKLENSSIAYDHLKTSIRKLQTALKNINDISVESMVNIYIKLSDG